ncbi:MAG: GIY-YIG nuclease family protein [Candidatus Omnitrophica bacterium]|nr:GIY-YIG nuclease family protein [Candidatus Omnitrophota bacterium]
MLNKQYYVYFLTNWSNKVLYVGVTNDLKRRVYEHRNGLVDGFTRRYHVHKLVYYEMCEEIEGAILREKQIKAGSRQKKVDLIKRVNPTWEDLRSQL